MIELRSVKPEEIEPLTQMSRRAFASDIEVGAPDAQGGLRALTVPTGIAG